MKEIDDIDRWVFIKIVRLPCLGRQKNGVDLKYDFAGYHLQCNVEHTYDIPRWVYDRYKWVISWRCAKIRCKHPMDDVTPIYSFYDRNTKLKLDTNSLLNKFISTKRMITKIENLMDQRKEELSLTLFKEDENDDMMMKLREKLFNYRILFNQYQEEINSAKEKIDELFN